jgi:hypothetical protein
MLVRSDQRGGLRIDAGHGAPESRDSEDAVDFYAIYRTFDGLAGYAFNGEAEGKRIALGMERPSSGVWESGRMGGRSGRCWLETV